MSTPIRLIVGLGNPGREYADTRHNVGFHVVDAFADARKARWATRREFEAETARLDAGGGMELHLIKPQTYMNESGRAVGAFCRYFKVPVSEVVVIYDELNLDFGRIKLTVNGSAGGHNGVASLLEHLGDGFRRFRVGIGPRQPPEIDLKDYVLGKITPFQKEILQKSMPDFLVGLDLLLTQGVTRAMNRLNRQPVTDDRSNQEKL